MTAAHNVFKNGKFPKVIIAYVGSRLVNAQRQATAIFNVCQYVVPDDYIKNLENKDNDYALLFFYQTLHKENFTNTEDLCGRSFVRPYESSLTKATLSGYPLYAYHEMEQRLCFACSHYSHSGTVVPCDDNNRKLLTHLIQSTGGQSGSSLRYQTDETRWSLFAMHLGYQNDYNTRDLVDCSETALSNIALKITQDIHDLLNKCEENLSNRMYASMANRKNERVKRLLTYNNQDIILVVLPSSNYFAAKKGE